MTLRPYQREAVDSLFEWFGEHPTGNPLVVLPTGSGKSHVIAEFVREALLVCPEEWILIISHRKEILQQNAQKLMQAWPGVPLAIFSAGLGSKRFAKVTVAGVQSVANAAMLPPFGLMIIDECHLLPKTGMGRYQTLIKVLLGINPHMRIIGFTATPFRLDSGMLCEGEDRIFEEVCYEAPIKELIEDGYLSPLISKYDPKKQADLSAVRIRGGEFKASDAEAVMDTDIVTRGAIDEMLELGAERKSWLVFCAGVDHAQHFAAELEIAGISTRCVFGETDQAERDRTLKDFKEGRFQALCNCDVLTTGFDAPNIDLVALVRPTKSASLYIQMVGRGSRLSPQTGKLDCLILDYGGNIKLHGAIDEIVIRAKASSSGDGESAEAVLPTKICPRCKAEVAIAIRSCPDCGYLFPAPLKTEGKASNLSILSGPREAIISSVEYSRHDKKGGQDSFKATYYEGLYDFVASEWICLEHEGFARQKAAEWWILRGLKPIPKTIDEALRRIWELRPPKSIIVRMEGKFKKVARVRFDETWHRGEAPEANKFLTDEDIPF